MKDISDNNIEFLKDQKSYTLFYFTASWCGPCQRIKPLIEEISKKSNNDKLEIYKIDIDENDKLSLDLNIESVPTFFLYLKDKYIDKCTGGDIKKVHKLLKDNME